MQAKVLDSIEVTLLFPEPQPVLDDIVGLDIRPPHEGGREREAPRISLVGAASKAIDATQKRFKGVKVPTAVKALTLYRLDGVLEILDSVKRATKSKKLKEDCDRLAEKVKKFVTLFELEGFGKGTFEEVEKVFQKQKFSLGREKFYRAALEGGLRLQRDPGRARTEGPRSGSTRSSRSTGTSSRGWRSTTGARRPRTPWRRRSSRGRSSSPSSS